MGDKSFETAVGNLVALYKKAGLAGDEGRKAIWDVLNLGAGTLMMTGEGGGHYLHDVGHAAAHEGTNLKERAVAVPEGVHRAVRNAISSRAPR